VTGKLVFFRKLPQEHLENANQRSTELTAQEHKRLAKLEGMAE
jgi:hypothetical protein